MSKFTVTPVGADQPLAFEVAIPPSWQADTSSGAPQFTIPGAETRLLTFAAVMPNGDADARMAKAIDMQYDDDDGKPGNQRVELSGGRVWIVRHELEVIHARMFVPFEGGVLMGVAMVTPEAAGHLPEIRTAFESITIRP
jgi:hypothetical protein